MSRQYVSTAALCPFYQMENAKSITCEGPGPGWTIRVSKDGNSGNAKDFKRKNCYDQWEQCPIAKMLQERYEKK